MTFKILNSSTNNIANRSNDRSTNDDEPSNLRADPITSPKVIKSLRDDNFKVKDFTSKTTDEDSSLIFSSSRPIPAVHPQETVGGLFF